MAKKQEAIKELVGSNEDAAKALKLYNRSGSGKPRIEEDQSDCVLSTILKIDESQSAAEPRWR